MSTEQMNGEAMNGSETEARESRSGVPLEGPLEHPVPPLTGSVGPQSPHQNNLKSLGYRFRYLWLNRIMEAVDRQMYQDGKPKTEGG